MPCPDSRYENATSTYICMYETMRISTKPHKYKHLITTEAQVMDSHYVIFQF